MSHAGGLPDQVVETTLDEVEAALDRGDTETALRLCEAVLSEHPDHPGALFLAAEAFRDLRDLDQAEGAYRRVTHVVGEYSPGWSGLGSVLFDRIDFAGAQTALQRAIRLDPGNPEPYYWRAMLRERRDDVAGAGRDYRRAFRLDPIVYPLPVQLDDSLVEAVVVDAIRSLHPSIQSYLMQVAIVLEEVPDLDVLTQFEPPAPPGEILGFFSGSSLLDRSLDNPWANLPSTITLYRCNLQRIAWDRERMLEELRITVFHEVGHFLGLDEDDLERRGLD